MGNTASAWFLTIPVRYNQFVAIKHFQLFRRDRILSADRPEQGEGIIGYVKDDIYCERT